MIEKEYEIWSYSDKGVGTSFVIYKLDFGEINLCESHLLYLLNKNRPYLIHNGKTKQGDIHRMLA